MLEFISKWFQKKSFNHNLNITRKNFKDISHPEKYKTRDGLKATEEAQVLRQNNDIVSSYLDALSSGVVGEGLTLQYKSDDEELNKKVESWLEYWSEAGNCCTRNEMFRQEAERFKIKEAAIKGGYIIRHHWDKRYKTLYKFEILSCDNIDRKKNNFSKNLYFGTQVNTLGQIDGLWLYNSPDRSTSTYVKMKRGNTPQLTLYLDIWVDPHQYTNITTIAATLNTLDKLAAYDNAEVKSAQGRADKSVIIATPTYEIMLKAQEEIMNNVKSTSSDKAEAMRQYMEMIKDFTPTGLHEGAIGVMPGSEVWDLKQTNDTVYADINENSKRILSKSLGLSPSTVTGIPESSYNVALKNAQQDETKYAIEGQKLIEKDLKITYRNAIEAGYLLGEYDIPDYYNTRERVWNRYIKITRKKRGHIDPLKQNTGDAVAVEQGFKSKVDVISDQGKDYVEVIADEVRYELERKKQFEDQNLQYIQTGTDKIALERAKQEIQNQDSQGE